YGSGPSRGAQARVSLLAHDPAIESRLGRRLSLEQHETDIRRHPRCLWSRRAQGHGRADQEARPRRPAVGASPAQPHDVPGDPEVRPSARPDDGDHRPRRFPSRLDVQPGGPGGGADGAGAGAQRENRPRRGRTETRRRRLPRRHFATPPLVLGFVDYMPELMRACDVTVTKAGPRAIAEALATGLPLIITGVLPGQEPPN